jgi:hypothetical protein
LYHNPNQGIRLPVTACELNENPFLRFNFVISLYFLRAFGKISKKKQIRACQVGSETYFRRPA